MPAGDDFVKVSVPFNAFSDKWSPSTGEQTTTCAKDADVCPTASSLGGIKRVEVWAEGVDGHAHLEIRSIEAVPASAELAAVAPADCASYRKVVDGECADDCLGSSVGICPRSIVVSTGGLEAGACKDIQYTVADGTTSQKAGPCGTLSFNKWKKAPVAVDVA